MHDEPSPGQPGEPGHSYFQNFQHTPIGARVPEKVGRGVFATALMVLQTNELFILDMFSMASQPQQVVARIIMTAHTFSQFVADLRTNVGHYETQFGPLKARFTPPHSAQQSGPGAATHHADPLHGGSISVGSGLPDSPPPAAGTTPEAPHGHSTSGPHGPITELYEQVRFPEDLLGGTFANAAMIRHTPEEFCFDFISSFYPRPIVVARVFAAAGRVPSFIEVMMGSLERYKGGGGGHEEYPKPE